MYNIRGDVIQLTDLSGNIVKTYDYDAYGNELQRDLADENPFRYCGEYYDTETGFIYLRARYYDPMVGRFTSVDPIKDGLNWYAYCAGNPVNFIDPNGKSAERGKNTIDVVEPDYYVVDGVKWYTSADDAAIAFGQEYVVDSAKADCEYGGIIVKKKMYLFNNMWHTLMDIVKLSMNGQIQSMPNFFRNAKTTVLYTYAAPSFNNIMNDKVYNNYQKGKKKELEIAISRKYGAVVALIHTHGKFTVGYLNDDFSDDYDMKSALLNGIPIYLATNGGELKIYTPHSRETELVSNNIPYYR